MFNPFNQSIGSATLPWLQKSALSPLNDNVSGPPSSYLQLTLRRPSLSDPWGLTLALHGGTHVIIGDVKQECIHSFIAEGHESYCYVDPVPFWDSSKQVNVEGWTLFLASLSVRAASGESCPILLPGDCILAIDGTPVLKLASSLKELTTYIRTRLCMNMLVYRNPLATCVAGTTLKTFKVSTVIDTAYSPAYMASFEAYKVLYSMFCQPFKRQLFPSAHSGALPQTAPYNSHNSTTGTCISRKRKPESHSLQTTVYFNPLFTDDEGKNLPFCDNTNEDDEHPDQVFVPPTNEDFQTWLMKRKATWKTRYKVRAYDQNGQEEYNFGDDSKATAGVDFWTRQGFLSFENWMQSSTMRWRQSYSWNKQKRRRIAQQCEKIVSIDDHFGKWLRVRKNQWLVLRRKRQRRVEQVEQPDVAHSNKSSPPSSLSNKLCGVCSPTSVVLTNPDIVAIDALLEEQEKVQQALNLRKPPDLLHFFDGRNGVPDDVVAHMIRYLDSMEHSNLVAISSKTRRVMCEREQVWRQLCPSHWNLPRRPRKPWHEVYFKTLRIESERTRAKVDTLLSKASNILLKGDQLQSIEKLVAEAERDVTFNINYCSGVICERNSILNLAVIHQRHKVVRWLVETKHADIETADRGQFTPLLNAAWGGDRYLVRFFMQKGASRAQVGTCHYTKPLAPADFLGHDAAGWAEARGYPEIAKLIRIGL
jgi:hypothetical protein